MRRTWLRRDMQRRTGQGGWLAGWLPTARLLARRSGLIYCWFIGRWWVALGWFQLCRPSLAASGLICGFTLAVGV